MNISGHVTRPATKIEYRSVASGTLDKPFEHFSVEWLMKKFVRESLSVFRSDDVVC